MACCAAAPARLPAFSTAWIMRSGTAHGLSPGRPFTPPTTCWPSGPARRTCSILAASRGETSSGRLIGIVSRFAGQKGFELIEEIASELLAEDLSLVALGTGDPRTERFFTGLAEAQPDRIARAHRLRQCARAQDRGRGRHLPHAQPVRAERPETKMYSLRYGTVPVVRATGGLDDTVDDETGFKFQEYSGAALLAALRAALAAYKQPSCGPRSCGPGCGRTIPGRPRPANTRRCTGG